jgi:hypothetical protein
MGHTILQPQFPHVQSKQVNGVSQPLSEKKVK